MNKAVFLDKDGTLVNNQAYPPIIPTNDLLEEQVIEGLLYLQRLGFKLIIISNQSWIGKRLMSVGDVEKAFSQLLALLTKYNIAITAYYYCPHTSSDNCGCKKPQPGLILQAAVEHNIDLTKSYFIGDTDKDILAGKNAGLKTVLVSNQYSLAAPDYIISNINHIKEVIPDEAT